MGNKEYYEMKLEVIRAIEDDKIETPHTSRWESTPKNLQLLEAAKRTLIVNPESPNFPHSLVK